MLDYTIGFHSGVAEDLRPLIYDTVSLGISMI
jgi:hypothetical protein